MSKACDRCGEEIQANFDPDLSEFHNYLLCEACYNAPLDDSDEPELSDEEESSV